MPPVYWPRLICKCVDGWRMLKETKKTWAHHITSEIFTKSLLIHCCDRKAGNCAADGTGTDQWGFNALVSRFRPQCSWNILKHLEIGMFLTTFCALHAGKDGRHGASRCIKMHRRRRIVASLRNWKHTSCPAARPALSDPRLNAVLRSKISILWLHEIQSKLLRNLANAGIFLWKGYIQPDSKNNWQFGVLTVIYLLKDEDWTTTSPCSGIYVLTAPTWTEKISHCHRESTSKASQQITGCSLQCCFRRPPLFHRFSFQMLREFCSVLFASLYSIKTRCDYLPDACEFLPQQWVKSFWPTCTSNLCSKLKAKQIYLQSN